jgi:hypothetical protein
MKNNILQQASVAGVLLILLLCILNPFNFWMPDMMHITVLVLTLLAFGMFAGFVLRENVEDERDGVHRMLAGRTAFLSGTAILVVGIISEAFAGTVDKWLILTLVVMVIAKIGARIYSDRNY